MAESVGPLEFSPLKYFSPKIIAITHVLLNTCLFLLCVLEHKKIEGKKAHFAKFHTKSQKCAGQNWPSFKMEDK